MCSRKRTLALLIASNFMVAKLHSQLNGEISRQKIQASRGTADNAALAPGHTYRDSLASGGEGPEMVVLPSGKFAMGSPKDEAGRKENEGPVHDVSVRSFALGKYPVTRGEFARFASATGYKTDAEKDTPSRPALELLLAALPTKAVAKTVGKRGLAGATPATSRKIMSRWCV